MESVDGARMGETDRRGWQEEDAGRVGDDERGAIPPTYNPAWKDSMDDLAWELEDKRCAIYECRCDFANPFNNDYVISAFTN